MALSGLHVVAGFAGGAPSGGQGIIQVLGAAVWSQTLASAGTTTFAAPSASMEAGSPVFSVRSSVDAWIAIGAAPNAAASPRRFLAANTDLDLIVKGGDKLAWTGA